MIPPSISPRTGGLLVALALSVLSVQASVAAIDGHDGYHYGAAAIGDCGAIMRSDNVVLYRFDRTRDGCGPRPSLILGSDGHLYGTTLDGGPRTPGSLPAIAGGTVFRLTLDGVFTLLHAFGSDEPEDGWRPGIGLVERPDDGFYGVTERGGNGCAECGTIFRIGADGSFSRLHAFSGGDGAAPSSALTLGHDGKLYGATDGSVTGIATLFSITTDGQFELLRTETVGSALSTTQTLAVEMLATVQTTEFPLPQTALLDNFNRPDNFVSLGESWPTFPLFYGGLVESTTWIQSNTVTGPSTSIGGNYWNTPLPADQEVYGYFYWLAYDTNGLTVRYDPVTGNGYAINWDGSRLSLYRVNNNQFLLPELAFTNTLEMGIGPAGEPALWLGLRAIGDKISVWRRSTDSDPWTKILEVTNNLVAGPGHVGFHLYHSSQHLDDIHAGGIAIVPDDPDDGGSGNGGGGGGDGGGGGGGGGDDDGSGGDGSGGDDNGGDGNGGDNDNPPVTSGGGGSGALDPLWIALLILAGRTTTTLCPARISRRKSR